MSANLHVLGDGESLLPRDLTEIAETPLEQRFLKKVAREGTCWIWQGARNPRGYGHFGHHGKTWNSHRVAYEWFLGPVPPGLELDHLCENTSCVNPFHLEPITHAENCRRGRRWRKTER